MATFVRVRNINPIGAVDVVDLYTGAKFTAAAGEVVEVDPETAGQAPYWRPATEGDFLRVHSGAVESREVDVIDGVSRLEVRELGNGLLAQVTNWELAETPTADTEV
jgi:hypothetical protein